MQTLMPQSLFFKLLVCTLTIVIMVLLLIVVLLFLLPLCNKKFERTPTTITLESLLLPCKLHNAFWKSSIEGVFHVVILVTNSSLRSLRSPSTKYTFPLISPFCFATHGLVICHYLVDCCCISCVFGIDILSCNPSFSYIYNHQVL